MSTAHKANLTEQQYLALERSAAVRSEFHRGEVFAMVGASRNHNLIALNVSSRIHEQLEDRRCEVYQSDMRVKVRASGLYTYPDVVAICGEPQFEDNHVDTLLNPQVVLEVLSPSTESWDRGRKFGHYRQVPSLQEYVLISQDRMLVEKFARQSDGQWLLSELSLPDEQLTLESIECAIRLSDIYAKVSLADLESGGEIGR